MTGFSGQKWFDPLYDELGELSGMRKSAKMTARISVAFGALATMLLIVSILSFGISESTPLIIGLISVLAALFLLNAFKKVFISSYLLCILPSVILVMMTIYLKSTSPGDDLHYFDSRIVLVSFCALPAMILSQREPVMLYSAIVFNLACIALYDPLHEAFGVGYYQRGFENPTYYHINTVSMVIGGALVAGSLTLKGIVIEEEDHITALLRDHEQQNQELEAQNEEISAQREQLVSAFSLIESQKAELEQHSLRLEEKVNEKSNDLRSANSELQKRNSELLQFSYSLSHNVRGPLARLLGLSNLITSSTHNLSAENEMLMKALQASGAELDGVIKELSRIIDIRNDIYSIKERIYFSDELQRVLNMLAVSITPEMKFQSNFSKAPFIYTIRPFLHSILYNLLSNSIRYKSPQRPLHVSVSSELLRNKVRITVEDNGLGINLEQFGNNIFGMYKRFHTHVEGKGLGLFLVKTQVEALEGTIGVESALNHGTRFVIEIKLPADIEGQVCFDCDYGSIVYNARLNIMGLSWKRLINSEEYRAVLTKCLEMLHVYRTEKWIADLRKRGVRDAADFKWFGDNILNEGSQHGLKTIACIDTPDAQAVQQEMMISAGAEFGVTIKFFDSRNEAEAWLENV